MLRSQKVLRRCAAKAITSPLQRNLQLNSSNKPAATVLSRSSPAVAAAAKAASSEFSTLRGQSSAAFSQLKQQRSYSSFPPQDQPMSEFYQHHSSASTAQKQNDTSSAASAGGGATAAEVSPRVSQRIVQQFVWVFPEEDRELWRDRVERWLKLNPRKAVILTLIALFFAASLVLSFVPHWLTSFARIIRSFIALAIVIIDYKYTMWQIEKSAKKAEDGSNAAALDEEEAMKQAHKRAAEKLLWLCLQNGGLFLKAGQHIASLNNILPPEYTQTMQPCQDQAPRRPFREMENLFLEEFGRPIDAFFVEFDREPIAAASLAQVHRARLRDGQQVAVKMQYPGLAKSSQSDIEVLQALVTTAEYFFPDLRLQWLIREFRENLPNELDFTLESNNCETVREKLHKRGLYNVTTPQVIKELSSKRILTLEFIEGCKINDKKGLQRLRANPAEVSRLLADAFSTMIFDLGFVHCDPHPGNIMVRRSRSKSWMSSRSGHIELVILDHGLYHSYDDDFKKMYAELWRAIVMRDEEGIQQCAKQMGVSRYDIFSVILTSKHWGRSEVGLDYRMNEQDFVQLRNEAQDHFFNITQVLSEVNRKVLLVLKCNDLLRSVQMELGVPINYFLTFARAAQRAISLYEFKEQPGLYTYYRGLIQYYMFSWKLSVLMALLRVHQFWSGLTRRSSAVAQTAPAATKAAVLPDHLITEKVE